MNEQQIREHIAEINTDTNTAVANRSLMKVKTDKDRHALHRWNERVGPKVMKKELDRWMDVYYQLGKFHFVTDVFGYIDDEIVFAYKTEKNKLIITTFYGRVSQKPVLKDIVALREFNQMTNQLVDLKLDKGTLGQQKMPSPADEVFLHMKKNRTLYVEKYITDSHQELLFYWEQNQGFKEVQLDKPELGQHDSLMLSFLRNNGYSAYVKQYQQLKQDVRS